MFVCRNYINNGENYIFRLSYPNEGRNWKNNSNYRKNSVAKEKSAENQAIPKSLDVCGDIILHILMITTSSYITVCLAHIVNLGTIANLRPISTKAKTMDTYEAITYSLYTNTKDLSYKNGI